MNPSRQRFEILAGGHTRWLDRNRKEPIKRGNDSDRLYRMPDVQRTRCFYQSPLVIWVTS